MVCAEIRILTCELTGAKPVHRSRPDELPGDSHGEEKGVLHWVPLDRVDVINELETNGTIARMLTVRNLHLWGLGG